MVFDPQCLITDRLASAFAGKLVSRTGRHWGPFIDLSARLLSEGRSYPPHFPIAVQATCDASLVVLFCERAELLGEIFLGNREKIKAKNADRGGEQKWLAKTKRIFGW